MANTGIEELSIQLEEPFSLLPLHKIAEGIGKSADEHFEWNEKDEMKRKGTAVNGGAVDGTEMRSIPLPSMPPAVPPAVPPAATQTSETAQSYASLGESWKATTPPAAPPAETQTTEKAQSYESLAESWKTMNGGQ